MEKICVNHIFSERLQLSRIHKESSKLSHETINSIRKWAKEMKRLFIEDL